MATGALACKVPLRRGEALSLGELRQRVWTQAGTPPGEQCIFTAQGYHELSDTTSIVASWACAVASEAKCTAASRCGGGAEADEGTVFFAGYAKAGACDGGRRTSLDGVTQLLLVRSPRDPRTTDLTHFHSFVSLEAPPTGSFTALRRLGRGRRGDVWLYRWGGDRGKRSSQCGQPVVAESLPTGALQTLRGGETSERKLHLQHASESWPDGRQTEDHRDALTEIGVLAYLAKQRDLPLYLLRTMGIFCTGLQKWFVTEFADGGELLSAIALNPRGIEGARKKRRYIWQLLQALNYLHRHSIGHRSVSLENIMLKDGNIRLASFSTAVRSHTDLGESFRYYRAVGRESYCAPECHIPSCETATVVAPSASKPGDIVLVPVMDRYRCEVRLPEDSMPNAPCEAELWGYAATPADIYAAGVCLYIVGMQSVPWRSATIDDPNFAYLYREEDADFLEMLQEWIPGGRLPVAAVQLMGRMLFSQPGDRPSAAECLESPWFADMAHAPVITHEQSLARTAAVGGC